MNREILFRGKRTDNGEWVYGYPVGWQNEGGDISIVDSRFGACIDESGNLMMLEAPFVTKVYPSTIGQYTGLTDKNGVKIFEGDVVRMHYFFENYHPVTLGAFEDESEIICKFSITPLGVYFESANMTGYLCDYLEDPEEELEVIGNAHDNPELLEENNT